MIINHNISALNTYRQLTLNNSAAAKNLEKLSSGFRINRAGDDAAGLAISEKMRGQIRGLNMASKNAQDGISLIQTAEGALTETHSILQRMRELAVQAANDTNTDADRAELQKEIDQLIQEIDRIAHTTEFNTKKLLNGDLQGAETISGFARFDEGAVDLFESTIIVSSSGDSTINVRIVGVNASGEYEIEWTAQDGTSNKITTSGGSGATITVGSGATGIFELKLAKALSSSDIGKEATFTARKTVSVTTDSSLTFHIGANSSQTMRVGIGDMSASALHVDNIKVTSAAAAEASVSAINKAIEDVSAQRAKLGAFQNRLEHTVNNLGASAENLTAAESRIRDVDYALAA